jgi:hypothetical protein
MLQVMRLLVGTYAYPVNGAAGLVGNLQSESGVLPQRVEGSRADTPMRAPDFGGTTTDFTADEIMNRSSSTRTGPRLPGIGLAQWTSANRRANLFTHTFRGVRWRACCSTSWKRRSTTTELRAGFAGVQGVLTNPSVTVDRASDEVVYNFEVPGAVIDGGRKLPRTDARVIRVFEGRRPNGRNAERIYSAAIAASSPQARAS